MFEQACCWIDGKIVPVSEAKVSVFDHGFLYGDGIFEGIRFYNRKVFRLPLHLKRFERSAVALQLTLPYSLDGIEAAIYETIKASPLSDGYLRVIVTRGVGVLGINPASCAKPSLIVIADELKMASDEQREKGVKAIITSTRRTMPDRLDSRIKSMNYLTAILARMEANYAGADEGILLNDRGFVAEGTVANLFVVSEGILLTPPATEGALGGITRQTILELAQVLNIPAREAALTAYDLYNAEECFFTGTGAKLIPIREIDGRKIRHCPGNIYRSLFKAFNELVQKETA
ncbi:branched-chain-amino-acid transaminase [Thiolinea disciformis]|uniref:branched-chain-amino-acid transaminase n=1 Tax=Thiolinea disciformis TaxID=125614 RepID=UPI0003616C10|nr:branched-chain-amino-acid transaminase [Thiolinea disciformis]